MRIERKDTSPTTTFDNLEWGDIFIYEDWVYMKITEVIEKDSTIPEKIRNAVSLEDATLVFFANHDWVEPRPNAYVIVE